MHRIAILTPRARKGLKVDCVCAPPFAGTVGQALGGGRLRELCPCLGRAKTRECAWPGTFFGTADGPRDVVIPYLGGRGLGSGGLSESAHHRANGHHHHVATAEMEGSGEKGNAG